MNNSHQRSTPDLAIAAAAVDQHGIVTRAQLIAAGFDGSAIAYRVRVGRLHRLHRCVYAVGHRPVSPLARAAAAVLACGPGAALSHWSAAVLWAILKHWPAIVDVTAPTSHRDRGIRFHRTRSLTADDTTVHYGIPVTTPARTLLDLADHLSDARLARAVNDARLHRLVTLGDLAAQLARSPGRATSRLRPFLEHPTGPTRSEMEDAFLAFVRRFDLPVPEINQDVEGHEVDALWRRHRLIVELDSRAFHDGDAPFEADRERDAELLAAGWRVIRITWRRLTEQPEREARRLAALLA